MDFQGEVQCLEEVQFAVCLVLLCALAISCFMMFHVIHLQALQETPAAALQATEEVRRREWHRG